MGPSQPYAQLLNSSCNVLPPGIKHMPIVENAQNQGYTPAGDATTAEVIFSAANAFLG